MLLIHLINGAVIVDHQSFITAPSWEEEQRKESKERMAVLEERLAQIRYKQRERERQIDLIAGLLHSTSFVKVHWDSTNEKAAAALYDKGMRVEEKK